MSLLPGAGTAWYIFSASFGSHYHSPAVSASIFFCFTCIISLVLLLFVSRFVSLFTFFSPCFPFYKPPPSLSFSGLISQFLSALPSKRSHCRISLLPYLLEAVLLQLCLKQLFQHQKNLERKKYAQDAVWMTMPVHIVALLQVLCNNICNQ